MIQIYRLTRYADVDQILFQASEETYQEFRRRFPVSIRQAKKGFEGGYHTFLREEYRSHFFNPIKAYFREKYVPPKVQLSAFLGTQCLSDRWSAQVWQGKVSEAIQTYFIKEGFSVHTDENADVVEVIPQKASLTLENVEVYWLVAYRIQMLESRRPLLWCYDRFRLLLDDRAASLEQIAKAHGEGSSVLQKIRQFTTRSAEDQFGVLQRFIKRSQRCLLVKIYASRRNPYLRKNLAWIPGSGCMIQMPVSNYRTAYKPIWLKPCLERVVDYIHNLMICK